VIASMGAEDDPFSMFSGWESDQLIWLAALVAVAVLVFFIGSKRTRSQMGMSALTPRGRDRFVPGGGHGRRDAKWRTTVARLEGREATKIAKAQAGPLRIEAEIVNASGNLGGAEGRECVWRNRAGAGPSTAIGAELMIVADATGRCGVESLEVARVTAPTDKAGAHYESVSLRVGDRVEILANFEREVVGEDDDPSQLVYGTLGADGQLEIRVLERPAPTMPPADDDES